MSSILASAYLHRIDPYAIRFTEGFGIRWYGLSYAFGFLLMWLFVRWMARTKRSSLTVPQAGDFVFAVIVGVLLGGRLGYVLFYDFSLLYTFSDSIPFWNLLAINKGGMASHGGMIGFILACVYFARRHDLRAMHLIDLGAYTAGIGLGVGRIANFVNAELWGRRLPDTLQANPPWWSVKYPEEILLSTYPVERLAEVETAARPIVGGDATFLPAVVHELRAGNEALIEAVRPLLTAYYPSQIFQSITDGLILVGLLTLIWLRPRKPGVISGWFLITYGVLRVGTEFFREPDVGVALTFGLSRGQVLSVLMVVAGVIWVWVTARRNVDAMGGLLRTP